MAGSLHGPRWGDGSTVTVAASLQESECDSYTDAPAANTAEPRGASQPADDALHGLRNASTHFVAVAPVASERETDVVVF